VQTREAEVSVQGRSVKPIDNAREASRLNFSTLRLLAVALVLVFAAACRQDMQDQPKYLPYRESTFPGFSNALSMRPPPEGTVARGDLHSDTLLFTGKMSQGTPGTGGTATGGATTTGGQQPGGLKEAPDATVFPFPITDEVMARGKERYEIYCSVCHGLTGKGDGMIVQRGYRRPPAYTDQRLLDAAVGHYFDVISNGWGAMPSYSQQVPVQDRWAIIAYIRALQRSQVGFTGSGSQNANSNNRSDNANTAQTPAANANSSQQTQAGGHR
jgi:mono/diheme cytochrome c family protein